MSWCHDLFTLCFLKPQQKHCLQKCSCLLHFILKELIQNAEDAGASEVKFMYDETEYGVESLWSPDMAQHQGESVNNLALQESPALSNTLLFSFKSEGISSSPCVARNLSCLSIVKQVFCSRSSALTSPWTGTRDCKVIHYYTVPLRTLCCRYGVVCLQWCCVHYGGLEWDSGDCEEQEERGSFESWTIWDWLQFCVPCHRWELFRNANYNFCYQMLLFSCQNNFLFNTAVSSNYTGKKYLCSR